MFYSIDLKRVLVYLIVLFKIIKINVVHYTLNANAGS